MNCKECIEGYRLGTLKMVYPGMLADEEIEKRQNKTSSTCKGCKENHE